MPETHPEIITLSRQYGSGGREIGKQLADALGYSYYDKELITRAAKKSGYSEEIFQESGEAVTHTLASLLSYVNTARGGGEEMLPTQDRLFIAQSNIIKEVAAHENCVIIGRCGD